MVSSIKCQVQENSFIPTFILPIMDVKFYEESLNINIKPFIFHFHLYFSFQGKNKEFFENLKQTVHFNKHCEFYEKQVHYSLGIILTWPSYSDMYSKVVFMLY